MSKPARALIIAGSDSSGGAGIQADAKAVTLLGGYAMTAITATTAQNTLGVTDIHPIPPAHIAAQIEACLSDIGADVIKIGMLHSAEVIETIAACLPEDIPLVLDPVMVATSGSRLLEANAMEALKTRLIPRATLLTPNLPEAELLGGADGQSLLALGAKAVLLKGGHGAKDTLVDRLYTAGKTKEWSHKRLDTPHTHGTGCTLASAIATLLAQGHGLESACGRAIAFVQAGIKAAPGLGKGHGPLGLKTPCQE